MEFTSGYWLAERLASQFGLKNDKSLSMITSLSDVIVPSSDCLRRRVDCLKNKDSSVR